MASFTSVGDMSRALSLRQASSRTKSLLTVLSAEMATGRKSDVPRALAGDTRRLASVEHRLGLLATYGRNGAELRGRLDATQQAMEGLQGIATGLGPALLASSLLSSGQEMSARLSNSRGNLEAALSFLNTQFAGEFVFAGDKTATAPLPDVATLMTQVNTAIGAATTVDDVIAAVDTYFDAPPGGGGFIDTTYAGGDPAGPVAVSGTRSVANDVTAASEAPRALLKGLTLAVLAADNRFTAPADQLKAVQAAGRRLMVADDMLTHARAHVGSLEEVAETASTRNDAEETALKIARNDMVRIDEYETSASLTETQSQLEAIYAITSRLSQLSLAKRL